MKIPKLLPFQFTDLKLTLFCANTTDTKRLCQEIDEVVFAKVLIDMSTFHTFATERPSQNLPCYELDLLCCKIVPQLRPNVKKEMILFLPFKFLERS